MTEVFNPDEPPTDAELFAIEEFGWWRLGAFMKGPGGEMHMQAIVRLVRAYRRLRDNNPNK